MTQPELNGKFEEISYSFFTPKRLYRHRFWDQFNTRERYWFNIPALMAVNKILYPDCEIYIQYSSDIKDNDKFILLKKLRDRFSVRLEENTTFYRETEPTIWRYKPVFNKTYDVVLCRDIDSLPTKNEYLATKYFMENDQYKVHTMRTNTNHTSAATIILAGLCGYRPKKISFLDFDYCQYYCHASQFGWGSDQNSLINIFGRNPDWTATNFLDSMLSSKNHTVRLPLIPCISHDETFYNDNVECDEDLRELLDILDEYTSWSGEPTDIRNDKLERLLKLDYEPFQKVKEIIEGEENLRSFYL